MLKKKRKGESLNLKPILQALAIGVASYFLLCTLILMGITPEQHDIQIGSPAAIDILATKEVNDTVTTEALREAAAAAVEPSYKSVDSAVIGEVGSELQNLFGSIQKLREENPEGMETVEDGFLKTANARLDLDLTRDQLLALMNADAETFKSFENAVESGARETLYSTLPEGQENTAILRLSRSLSVSGFSTGLVGSANEILTRHLRANMLIDEEITEDNRQKARDAVEMKTCVKGEMIVREGEIVTEAQYSMISALGLLKEDSLDIPLFGGVALSILLIMVTVGIYLKIFNPQMLRPSSLSLLCLISVIVVALSLLTSRWNAYLMPVSLGMMLLSLLVGRRLSLFLYLAQALLVSLLTNVGSGLFGMAMFSVTMMALVNGPIVLAVYSKKIQRVSTLYAGALVAVSNFAVTLAVGMISTTQLSTVLTNAIWALGSGILSAVLCIGLQPVLEMMFNLATSAKLLELSNPNQPLLRRLLLEAPGTYHHSIIVANLAEAAASAVGGNGLLARVGAYYHDVGKLKRPMYFKENQMGDNPHDRTDPRVSAAILTAHPRDGLAMAQKEKIPQQVLEIISQHHGDTPAMYFYDKALKLYGDETDIADFRYAGPRPRSKEAAIVMCADTVEAAARTLPNPTPEKIDALIRKLVRSKMNDGQLDECDLTFADLDRVCAAFSTVLTGVFHERIEYPDIEVPPKKSAEEDRNEQH